MSPQNTIALVIPTYNSHRTLPSLLNSVFAGTAQPDEVIVADDGSPVMPYVDLGHTPTCYLTLPHNGPAAARDAGWRHATAEWIAFVDSDCTVTPEWCQALNDAIRTHPDVVVLEGPVRETCQVGFFRHWAQNLKPGRYPTANVVYRRRVLDLIGGLDMHYQWGRLYFREDSDLALRALQHGPSLWVPDAVILHHGHRISVAKKLVEVCRYTLDPLLLYRHGVAALSVDHVNVANFRVPAPRQLTALAITCLCAISTAWHGAIWFAVALTTARAAWILAREHVILAELPYALLEQAVEPFVLTASLVAGIIRVVIASWPT